MNLGNKIRELRRAKGLTQEQLAASLNITPQAVSKWEMSASYPDMAMIPAIASLFRVTLDELFDFDLNSIDKDIEDIRLEYNKYFWSNFEKAEQILLDGLKTYPASIQLKTELMELYAYNVDRGDEIVNKAFELSGQIVQASQDVFCTCRTKASLIHVYKYLEIERGEDHYEEIKKIIESLPYMYPYMLQDRMRLSASLIKGEEGMKEAVDLKNIEWQEFFIACQNVGNRYYEAYPIFGTHSNHAITLLEVASCMFLSGKNEGIDGYIERAKYIYFDAYEHTELKDYSKTMREMIEYFPKQYAKLRLNEYAPLDIGEIEKRIAEHHG